MSDAASARSTALTLLSRHHSAFNAGDHTGMLSLPTDGIAHDTNLGKCELGHAAFAGFLKRMHRSYSEQLVDIVLFADETGTRAAAGFTVLGTYQSTDERLPPATGQTYKLPAGAFFPCAMASSQGPRCITILPIGCGRRGLAPLCRHREPEDFCEE